MKSRLYFHIALVIVPIVALGCASPNSGYWPATSDSLYAAIEWGDIKRVKLLIAEKPSLLTADMSVPESNREREGSTPLHFAAGQGQKDIVKLLLARGTDVQAKDKWGFTPLHEAAEKSQREIIKILVARGADVNSAAISGDTPLHFAVRFCSVDPKRTIALLLAKGADVNAKTETGETPLLYALKDVRSELGELLLRHGADPNPQDRKGTVPLHYAIVNCDKQMVTRLIDAGAEVNPACTSEVSPLVVAIWCHKDSVADLLRLPGAAYDIFAAILLDDCARVEELLRENPNLARAKRPGGLQTPLHCAAAHFATEILELLLTLQLDVNAMDAAGRTPLHRAVMYCLDVLKCDTTNIELLINKGADVNAQDGYGLSPLHIAALTYHPDLAKLLLKHGADVNVADFRNRTPTDLAAYFAGLGYRSPIHVLRQHGGSENQHGKPLDTEGLPEFGLKE